MNDVRQEYEVYWLKRGTILADRYLICDAISEGGVGIVYLGVDIILHMNVAIKEYFPRHLVAREKDENAIHIYQNNVSEERFFKGIQKFLNEARMLAQFHKLESVVTVRDFFCENNTAYIVNEHIIGENVKEYVSKHGRIEADKVLSMMLPILKSLSVIHKTGFLHRDIAPDNIIIQDEKAVLIDFGAARLNEEDEEYSKTVSFKRGYSAEEQYIRRGKQGPATDIYAVCATMYFMLTGIQPDESVQRHIKDNVISLEKQRDIYMPKVKKKAIMKGMSVSIKDRYDSVEELCRILYQDETEKKSHRLWHNGVAIFLLLLISFGHMKLEKGENTEPFMKTFLQKQSMVSKTETEERHYIPDVKKMKKKQAVARLKKELGADVKLKFSYEFHKKVKKGYVITQSVSSGTLYKKEQKIELKISKGVKVERKKQR